MAQMDIDELLNSIKVENEHNGEKFEKALDEISAKLDNMASGNETEELVSDNILSLKADLETSHRYVIEKFENVRDSIEVFIEKQDLLTKNSDLKIMFNILNENIDNFIQNVAEQKSMIDILASKLDEFRNDTSKKDEIIENVTIVKENVDDVKRGLESSIIEVNSSLKNITKTLMTMDVTEQNDIIKRELENLYLATNAILSSIQISDQKNDEIAKNIVTKNDLISFSGKMDNSFALVNENLKAIDGSERAISEIEKNIDELRAFSENISSELSDNLTTFKLSEYKIDESLTVIADLKSKLDTISADFAKAYSDANSQIAVFDEKISSDFSGFKLKLSEIDENLNAFKYSFKNFDIESKTFLARLIDESSEKIGAMLSCLQNDDINNELENLKLNVADLGTKLEDLKVAFASVSAGNVEKILTEIRVCSEQDSETLQNIAGIMDHNFSYIGQNLDKSSAENKQNFDEIGSKIDKCASSLNPEKIVSKLESLESKINMANVDIATDLDTNADIMKEFIDEYRHDNIKSSEEVLTLSDNIKNFENELVENSNKFYSSINSQLNGLNAFILELKDLCEKDDVQNSLLEQVEKLQTVDKSLSAIGEKFSESFECLHDKVADYSKAVADISLETKGKLGLSLEEINSVKSELASVLERINDNGSEFAERVNAISDVIIAKFDEISESITDMKNSFDSELESIIRDNLLSIEGKFVELQGVLSENSEKIEGYLENSNSTLSGKIDDLRQEIGLINTDLSEIIATKTGDLVKSFVPLKETIDTFVGSEFDKLVDNIKSQIELAYLNFSSDVNESLAENHDNYVHLEDAYKVIVDKFAEIHKIVCDLNENQIGLMLSTIKEIDKTQSDNFENTNLQLTIWKSELTELNERFDMRLSGIEGAVKRGFLEQKAASVSNKDEIKSVIEPLLKKNEFEEKISEYSADLNESIFENSSDIKSGINTSAGEIKSEISRLAEQTETSISTLQSSVENLDNKSESFAKANQAEQIEEIVNSLNEKIDILAMSSDAEVLQEMVTELQEKVDVIAMSSDAEVLQDMIMELQEKIDVLVSASDVEILQDTLAEINEKMNALAMSDETTNIENLVQTLHEKVDVLAAADDADLYNGIQDIKDLINEQRKQIEDFGSEGSDFDKRLQSLLTEISNIDLEKSASDIKDSVMNAVLAVTDQITFTEETEEIKDFVEERTEEINRNLLDVKKQLCSMASGSDAWDYSYTMQDIESDIAKLRLILNDISSSTTKEDLNEISKNMHKLAASVNTLHTTLTEDQINELKDNVSKINEDVVSLSTRTNKLLLNSDESHKALIDGLEELNRVLSAFGNSSASEIIEKKLDNINAAITTSANMDNVMREVMLYLGEWIDDASEKINTIASDTSNLSSITSELCYLKSMIGNSDIIESIRKKFEVQQARIDNLDAKLDRIVELFEVHNPEIIENKIESYESKTDLFVQKMELFDKKFEAFDKKLKGLDDKLDRLWEGLEKLVSYVD